MIQNGGAINNSRGSINWSGVREPIVLPYANLPILSSIYKSILFTIYGTMPLKSHTQCCTQHLSFRQTTGSHGHSIDIGNHRVMFGREGALDEGPDGGRRLIEAEPDRQRPDADHNANSHKASGRQKEPERTLIAQCPQNRFYKPPVETPIFPLIFF